MTSSQILSEPTVETDRKQLIAQSLTARTHEQIEQATRDLRWWVASHPEDVGMEDLFEVLALRTPPAIDLPQPMQEAA